MKKTLSLAVLLAALSFPERSPAQTMEPANNYVEPCQRAAGSDKPRSVVGAIREGQCFGLVRAIFDTGQYLQTDYRFCSPKGATLGQAILILNKYFADNPADLHLPVTLLAVRAYRLAWPCR